jgi:hypothetical protein
MTTEQAAELILIAKLTLGFVSFLAGCALANLIYPFTKK